MHSPDEARSRGGVPDENIMMIDEEDPGRDPGAVPPATGPDPGSASSAAGRDAGAVPSATAAAAPEAFSDPGPIPPATGTAPPEASGYTGTAPPARGSGAGGGPPEPSGNADAGAAPPATDAGAGARPAAGPDAGASPGTADTERWSEIQAMFVDDPRGSVQQAADLADAAIKEFVSSLRQRLTSLASSWQAVDTGTEKLRGALRDYRAFWAVVRDMRAAGRVAGGPAGRAGADEAGAGRAPAPGVRYDSQPPASGPSAQPPSAAR